MGIYFFIHEIGIKNNRNDPHINNFFSINVTKIQNNKNFRMISFLTFVDKKMYATQKEKIFLL